MSYNSAQMKQLKKLRPDLAEKYARDYDHINEFEQRIESKINLWSKFYKMCASQRTNEAFLKLVKRRISEDENNAAIQSGKVNSTNGRKGFLTKIAEFLTKIAEFLTKAAKALGFFSRRDVRTEIIRLCGDDTELLEFVRGKKDENGQFVGGIIDMPGFYQIVVSCLEGPFTGDTGTYAQGNPFGAYGYGNAGGAGHNIGGRLGGVPGIGFGFGMFGGGYGGFGPGGGPGGGPG